MSGRNSFCLRRGYFKLEGAELQEFKRVLSNSQDPSINNETRDYWVMIDCAKHLCMLSRSDRGKEARNYFVEMESLYPKKIAAMDPFYYRAQQNR